MKVCISYSLLFKDERGFSLRFPSCEHPTRGAANSLLCNHSEMVFSVVSPCVFSFQACCLYQMLFISFFFRKYLLYLCNKVNCCLLFGVLLLVLHFWFKASKVHNVCSISVLIKSLSSKLCISIIKSKRHILSMKSLSISRCSIIYLLCPLSFLLLNSSLQCVRETAFHFSWMSCTRSKLTVKIFEYRKNDETLF